MNEIAPGIHHWTALHPRIGLEVSSYYLEPAGTLIDPMLPPDGGVEALPGRQPERIVLTNRHHHRDSDAFVEAFGCAVLCHEAGLHEFEGGPEVEGFAFGDRLAEGIVAHEVGVICPEETALEIDLAGGSLALADAVIRYGGELRFVTDDLLGDDPAAIKAGLLGALSPLAELDPDTLLLAHGDPLVGGGGEALRRFVEQERA